MNIKHRKKWRRAPWNPNIMIPYMSYHLCESYRDVSGKACKRTVLNIGELEGFSEAQIHELGKMLTEMIKTDRFWQLQRDNRVSIASLQQVP